MPADRCPQIAFSGKGFQWFGVGPAKPLVIPGDLKKVTLHYKVSDKRIPLIVKFQDGWGRAEAGTTKFEWAPTVKEEGQWAQASFDVPAGWVRPGHNAFPSCPRRTTFHQTAPHGSSGEKATNSSCTSWACSPARRL